MSSFTDGEVNADIFKNQMLDLKFFMGLSRFEIHGLLTRRYRINT